MSERGEGFVTRPYAIELEHLSSAYGLVTEQKYSKSFQLLAFKYDIQERFCCRRGR